RRVPLLFSRGKRQRRRQGEERREAQRARSPPPSNRKRAQAGKQAEREREKGQGNAAGGRGGSVREGWRTLEADMTSSVFLSDSVTASACTANSADQM